MGRLAYTWHGPQEAPVLVLGNSLGTTREMWAPQVAALAGPLRVLTYDQLGHGESDVPAGPYTVDGLGRELLGLCDEFGVGTFHYAGLSLGGMVGCWLGVHAASRVDSLALLCTSAHPDPEGAFAQRAETVRRDGVGAIVDAVLARWFTPEFHEADPDTVARTRAMMLGTRAEGYAACCEAIATLDLRAGLPSVTTRTLVVGGGADPSIPPEHQRRIAAAVPGARLEILADTAHLANLQRPDAVTALLRDHLGVP